MFLPLLNTRGKWQGHAIAAMQGPSRKSPAAGRSPRGTAKNGPASSPPDGVTHSPWLSAAGRPAIQSLAVCAFLFLGVLIVFGRTVGYQFVNLDDRLYVYQNKHVTGGLSGGGIVWAFTHFCANNWHPLTWMSHMLDCQFYGSLAPEGIT